MYYLKNTLDKLPNVHYMVSGAALSKFKSGGPIACVAYPDDKEALCCAVALFRGDGFIVGAGSNLLISDAGYGGAVISTRRVKGCLFCGNTLLCAAGETLPALAAKAASNNLSGLEALSDIPATLGGAVANNAGAFGESLSDVLISVTVCDRNGKSFKLTADELGLGYHKSAVKAERLAVCSAELALLPKTEKEIAARTAYFRTQRRQNQPQERSLGSVFCRVNGTSAGLYIERAGLKGTRIGGACISEKHANFIVNLGGASSEDYLRLVELAKTRVRELFDIELTEEIEYLYGHNGKDLR